MQVIKRIINKLIMILLFPFILIKNIITRKNNNKKLSELENVCEYWFDKYGENIMFKLVIGENTNDLIIYSKNYKTTLDKAKKGKEKENDNTNANQEQ